MTMDFTDIDSVDKRREKKQYSLDVAEVVSVPSDGGHTISVRRLGDQGGVIGAPVLVPSKGDIGLPQPGDLVILGFAIGGQRIVLGTLYENDAPSYSRGTRRISHSITGSNITITPNGNIEINADGEVLINGEPIGGSVELHGNEAHTSVFAVDGDTQPPETHNNTAHSETYATITEVNSVQTTLDGHIADTNNPHSITPEQINAVRGDGTSKITVSATAPTNPSDGDIWIDTS